MSSIIFIENNLLIPQLNDSSYFVPTSTHFTLPNPPALLISNNLVVST